MDPYVVGLAVAGWLATTWLAFRWGLHSKTLERQEAAKSAVKTRRREFCSFLRGWRADFDYRHMQTHGYKRDGGAFVNMIPSFVQQADMVRGDLTGDAQKRFGELVAAISARRGGDVIDKERYDQLLKDFDELISLVESKTNDA